MDACLGVKDTDILFEEMYEDVGIEAWMGMDEDEYKNLAAPCWSLKKMFSVLLDKNLNGMFVTVSSVEVQLRTQVPVEIKLPKLQTVSDVNEYVWSHWKEHELWLGKLDVHVPIAPFCGEDDIVQDASRHVAFSFLWV
mgnify:CR=1 FL=1